MERARRILPWVGWLIWLTIALGFVLIVEFTLFAANTVAFVNVVALVFAPVPWEYRRLQRVLRERQAEKERDAERRKHEEQEGQRQRQAEQRREAERRRRQAEEEREAERRRQRQREATAQQTEWWSVLEVARSASKDEIVRNYRRKILQCHPDRVAGLAPEFLRLAEERTKTLNVAYGHAMRARR